MEIFATIGLSVCIIIFVALISGWIGTLVDLHFKRSESLEDEDMRDVTIYTRKLYLWYPMPIIWPVVLVVLLFIEIFKVVRGFFRSLGQLRMPKEEV